MDTARLRDATAKMMACKAAIKANRYLRQDEMESLVVSVGSMRESLYVSAWSTDYDSFFHLPIRENV